MEVLRFHRCIMMHHDGMEVFHGCNVVGHAGNVQCYCMTRDFFFSNEKFFSVLPYKMASVKL